MKLIQILCFIILFSIESRAGFVIGYQGGRWVPGLGTLHSDIFFKEQKYGANFKYNHMFHGVYIGYRYDFKKMWLECNWNSKNNSFNSEYKIDEIAYKDIHKQKLNSLVLCGGYKIKGWGIGMGMYISKFTVKAKHAELAAFSSAEWYAEHGGPIVLFPPITYYPAFDFCAERNLGDIVILKLSYFWGVGDIKFADFHQYKPNNLTLSLLFNLGNNKKE